MTEIKPDPQTGKPSVWDAPVPHETWTKPMDEPGIAGVITRGLELRQQRAEELRAARKFTPLDRQEIEPIRGRAEKATPGPYRVRKVAENGQFYVESLGTYGHSQRWIAIANCYASPEEADFVMHCHGDIPALLLDNLFLRHYLDGLQDEANGRLDELNDARRAIRDLRAALAAIVKIIGADPEGEEWWQLPVEMENARKLLAE